jgi:hypothetical protein
MSTNNISFNDEDKFKIRSRSIFGTAQTPKMISALVGRGIVKNEKQAMYILFLITFLALAATGWIIKSNFFPTVVPPRSQELDLPPEVLRIINPQQ